MVIQEFYIAKVVYLRKRFIGKRRILLYFFVAIIIEKPS